MSDSVSRPPAASRIPAKIGRYDVLGKLGSGRTGTVYRATDPFIGRALAIKTFRVDLEPGPQRDRYLQRFYHEARISGGLSHPNIVALFDVGEMDGLPYLVFEHVECPTLDVALARAGRLDSAETIRVVEQVALALDFAHSRGIVHRDIRPANIILAADTRVRVAEFGIARIEGSQLTQHGEILGTPAYMSPEQIRGRELSASSDLFSLAVCAYEMLSGQRPFKGESQVELLEALVHAPPEEPKALRSLGIPSREFMFVFERALAKEPSHRFADASSFARALKSCLGVVGGEAPLKVTPIAIPDPLPSPPRQLLPPTAPPPPPVRPPAPVPIVTPPPAPDPRAMDTSATAEIDLQATGIPLPSSADATLVSSSFEPGSFERGPAAEVPAAPEEPPRASPPRPDPAPDVEPPVSAAPPPPAPSPSAEATLISMVGFGEVTRAKPAADPDATDADGPATNRLSREAVEALLTRAAPRPEIPASPRPETPVLQKTIPSSADAPVAEAPTEIENLVSPTSEMTALNLPLLDEPAAPSPPTPAETLYGDQSPAGQSSSAEDKTVMMTAAERSTARDRPFPTPRRPATGPAVAKPTPPAPTRAMPRPAPPAPRMRMPPRPTLAPKLLLAGLGLLTLFAIGLGAMFMLRATRGTAPQAEMWNNLPVYPESQADKSPILFSHENPQPVLEPGRVVSVTLSWIVTPEGLVDDPKIVVSASPEIDAFVTEGVRKWRYEPGQKDGKTVPIRVLRKYTFGQRSGSEGS